MPRSCRNREDASSAPRSSRHPRLLRRPAGGTACPGFKPKRGGGCGPGARLFCDDSANRFDVLPLLVATDGAIAAFGYDGRRLRPNIVGGGVSGLNERRWEGQSLRIGDVLIA